jgi:hypothetical protein
MTNQINSTPAAIQLRYAIGASVAIRMDASKPDGTPFDLSPYTITAPFVYDSTGTAPTVTGWLVNVDLATSSVHLSLTEDDTAALSPRGKSVTWHWVVWLDNNTAPERIMFAHGDLGLLQP